MPPYDKMSLWRYFIMLTNEIQKMKITGKEIYGIYKTDICYVSRDEIERTLQIIVPETTPNQGEPDSPEGLEIGSKNVYGHPYFWSEPTLSLIEQFFKKHIK